MICLEPLSTIPVDDDYDHEPYKCYGGVEMGFHINLIFYPLPQMNNILLIKTICMRNKLSPRYMQK